MSEWSKRAEALSRPLFCSEPGSHIRPEYQFVDDPEGGHLEQIGQVDTEELMLADAASSALPVLIARFANGDTSALAQAQGFYADVTGAPHTLAEAYQMTQDAQAVWDVLSPDQKAKFDGFADFCGSAGSERWFNAFAPAGTASPAPEGSDVSDQGT